LTGLLKVESHEVRDIIALVEATFLRSWNQRPKPILIRNEIRAATDGSTIRIRIRSHKNWSKVWRRSVKSLKEISQKFEGDQSKVWRKSVKILKEIGQLFEEDRETEKDWPKKGILAGKLRGFLHNSEWWKVKMRNGGLYSPSSGS
jgi:hypothetical protein